MPESRNLVAVVVTYNRLEKLKKTIEKSLHNDFYRVVVVDNAATDGTGSWLDTLDDPRLCVIHSKTNLGGAGGFHLGFQYVAEKLPGAEWLVCFDDDAYPEDNVAAEFTKIEIAPDVGTLGGAVYLPDGRISEMNRPSRNPFWHLSDFLQTLVGGRQGFHIEDAVYYQSKPIDIDSSSVVGCFNRLSLIREGKIGLPRKELFIYADDIIYVLESRKAGYRHWFVPTLKFGHDCETLINQQDVYHPLWKAYYVLRNRLEMYRVAAGIFYPAVFAVKIPAFFMSYRFYEKHERKKFLQVASTAIWDGLRKDFSKSHSEVVRLSALDAPGG